MRYKGNFPTVFLRVALVITALVSVAVFASCNGSADGKEESKTEREVLGTCCIPCTHGGAFVGTDENGGELYAYPTVLKMPANVEGMKTVEARQLYFALKNEYASIMKVKFPEYYSDTGNQITYKSDGYTVIYEYDGNGVLENVKKIDPEGTLCEFPGR